MIKQILIAAAAVEVIEQLRELRERRNAFNQARNYANSVGKPLLVIGTPKLVFNHPCGDVTIDINPDMARYCSTEVADIRAIPYGSQYFGAAFVSHVLEHLPTVTDAHKALDELHRVAEKVFIVSPSKISVLAWIYPEHHLWVTKDGDGYIIEQRGRKQSKTASCLMEITATS